jgi:lipopolysaccharide transport system permease protein
VRHALPFVIQLWFFTSPVIYATGLIPDAFRVLYSFNPMVGIIEGFRWALLGGPAPLDHVVTAAAMSVFLLVAGLLYFRHRERTFADLI